MWAVFRRRRLRRRSHGPLVKGGDEVFVLEGEDVAVEAERPIGGSLVAARRHPPQRGPRRLLTDVVVEDVVEHELTVVLGCSPSPSPRRLIIPLVILVAVIGLVLLLALFPGVRSAVELVRGLLDAIP